MFIDFIKIRDLRLSMIFFLITSLFCSPLIAQTTRLVPSSYSTIAAAISAAVNGDTIDITGTITESTITINKNLIIRGHGRTNTTVNNSGGTGNVFTTSSGITAVIKEMTISNGQRGIYIYYSNMTISGCDVCYNSQGGISCGGSTAYFINIINSNICYNGGTGGSGGAGILNGFRGALTINANQELKIKPIKAPAIFPNI